jgi:hypothetical protein
LTIGLQFIFQLLIILNGSLLRLLQDKINGYMHGMVDATG